MSKGGAWSVREVLLKTLEDLGDEDFKKFKWFLQDSDILGDLGVIPKCELEKADRKDTVDKIIQKYNQQSVEVVKKILEKINRADLVETLSSSFRTAEREEALLRPPVVKATKDAQKNNTSLKYENIISKSALIQSGSPTVYQLKPNKKKFGTWTGITVGEKDPAKTNRTILLVGETGTGKSTLINTLVNYTMGVKWEDDVWFQIVEDEKRSQSESQTSDVIVYQIFGFEDKTLPYSLTIIDTPGYGDTRGIEHDVIVSHNLLDLFRSEDGVHEINVVGLVLKATENRVSDRLRYIFDSVLSLFGKDMEMNIVALITYSDGRSPKNVLKTLEAAKIEFAKDKNNQPVHFLFNNCQDEDRTEDTDVLKHAAKTSTKGLRQFTDFLEKIDPQKLRRTVKVLNERITLTACVQNLKERVEFIELKQKEQQTQGEMKTNEQEKKKNEKFTVEVDEVYKVKEPIDGWWWGLMFYEAAVCCKVCEENCHYPGCTVAWSPGQCEVMKDGRCTVCTRKCPVSDHVKDRWIYVTKTRKVQQTQREVKEKY
ncbi:septin-2-like [Dicentrarchus labrax]|uniref:Pyrin domain-containing protein n=1 Tax=Dicentrarchus labrax TaxID=13489 RepID=A0A8C4DZX0_DICLA|nr:septin-2-like [Dicentrarchus labrax]